MKKIVWMLLFTLVIASCKTSEEGNSDTLMAGYAPIVTTMTMLPQVIEISESYPARVKAFRHAQIRPQVGGIVIERLFEQGAEVVKGQPLFQINDEQFQVALLEAKASLDRAEAEAMRAHYQVNRLQKLTATNATTKQQYEEAEAQYKQSVADIAHAKAQLRKAELDIQYAKIEAPISGKIGQSLVSEGALVSPNDAEPLALIQQIDKVYIDVKQPLSQIESLDRLTTGLNLARYETAKVTILNSEGQPYNLPAKLLFTELEVNETMGDSLIRIEVDNTQNRLRPGMYVRVQITFGEVPEGLLVPAEAISRNHAGKPQVMVINAQKEGEYREITLGQQKAGFYIVKSGLDADDEVVIEGHSRAMEHSPITIEPWNPNLEEKYQLNNAMQAKLDEIMALIDGE